MLVLAVLVYALGLLVPLKDTDGAFYARVAMEMHDTGNYAEIRVKGEDWLDKPHFQFWVTALAYEVFGVHHLAFKIAAFLFTLLGVFYTYRFGARFYSRLHGVLAAVLLVTAYHHILSNEDVRAETYLTGLTIFSLFYFARYLEKKSFGPMLLGCLGLAGLLMTKGPYTIFPVAAGIAGGLLYARRWKEILHWQWLVAAALTLLLTAPTLVLYYLQFDAHPEKVVHGETGVSGVWFFLWESQWGRFAQTGPITRHGDLTEYFHVMLWAYAPWALLGFFALGDTAWRMLRGRPVGETYTWFGFVAMFVVFSFSRFQLPHYIVPIFPLLSVVAVASLLRHPRSRRFRKAFTVLNAGYAFLLAAGIVVLHVLYFDRLPHVDTLVVVVLSALILVVLYRAPGRRLKKIVFGPAILVLLVGYWSNRDFYPDALRYESVAQAVRYVEREGIPPERFVILDKNQCIGDVEMRRWIPDIPLAEFDPAEWRGHWVYARDDHVRQLEEQGVALERIHAFDHFSVTKPTVAFLNKRTRAEAMETYYLIRLE